MSNYGGNKALDCWVLCARNVAADIPVKADASATPGGPANAGGASTTAAPVQVERSAIHVDQLLIPNEGITAIIGESGSGKSTLLGILTGLIDVKAAPPAEGSVGNQDRFASELVFRAPGCRDADLLNGGRPSPGHIGFVFQDSHLLKGLSAKRNAALGAMIAVDVPTREVFSNWSERFQLAEEGSKTLEKFSGGQQQRIATMRALGMDPTLLVCDEPTSSLDKKTAHLVMEEIALWASQPGRSVLWVTHNRDAVARFAHRFIGVCEGRVLAHNGRPIDLAPALSYSANMSSNVRLIDQVLGASHDPAPVARQISKLDMRGERHQASWLQQRIASLRALRFAFSSSMADAMSGYSKARSANCNRISAAALGVLTLCLRSLTLVLLLGLTVFYGVYTAYSAFDKYFTAQLRAPESSYFLVSAREPPLLAPKKLPELEKALKRQNKVPPDNNLLPRQDAEADEDFDTTFRFMRHVRSYMDRVLSYGADWRHGLVQWFKSNLRVQNSALKDPKFFGRRGKDVVPIWLASGKQCVLPSSGGIGPSMIVYDRREPLFLDVQLTRDRAEQPKAIKALPASILRDGVIVTPNVFGYLGVKADAGTKPKGFCIEMFGSPTYVTIAGTAKTLPGGGDKQYSMAMEVRTYQRIFSKVRPEIYKNESGRLVLPAYKEAAGYFDYRDRDRVFCKFLGCSAGKDDPVKACRAQNETDGHRRIVGSKFSGYILDCDSLAQVGGLIDAARGASVMFAGLALAFVIAIAMSTALAARSLVVRNEKPIAVMRAFGYGLKHVFVLLFAQLILMFVAAGGLFAIIVAIFDRYFAPKLAAALDAELADLTAHADTLLVASTLLMVVVGSIALIVLVGWWLVNRRIGPVLQSL